MKVEEGVWGKDLSYIRTGGRVSQVLTVFNEADFFEARQMAAQKNVQCMVIGGGTNILIADTGYKGILIKNAFSQIQINKKKREVEVASGTLIKDLITRYKEAHLTGMEYFVGVPGTVGGALMSGMHVGGLEFRHLVKRVEVIDRDGKQKWVPMEYVVSHLIENQEPEMVLRVVLVCAPVEPEVLQERLFRFTKKRIKQYHAQPSLFCPYVGLSAQTLRLLASKKSFALEYNQAHFWSEYENYLVNTGNANSEDVLRLAQGPQEAFYQLTGQSLRFNVKLIGDFYITNL